MSVPNPDGESWDVLQMYMKYLRKEQRIYIVDLGTNEVALRRFEAEEGKTPITHARFTLHTDGRLYGVVPNWYAWRTGGLLNVYRYDPAANEFSLFAEIPGMGGERYSIASGTDGKLWGTAVYIGQDREDPDDKKVVTAFSLNPETREVRRYGKLGPRHETNIAYAYWFGHDGTHMYIASGKIPWYLVAVDKETGEETVLLEAPKGDYKTRMRVYDVDRGGAFAYTQRADDEPKAWFWLWQGEAIPEPKAESAEEMAALTPPWPDPGPDPAMQAAAPEPGIYRGQIVPDPEGTAVLWVRETPEAEWRSIRLENVETHLQEIHRFTLLPDGRIYGSGPGYNGRFVFDPEAGETTQLGNMHLETYVQLPVGDAVYMSGYASAPLWRYDPALAWTVDRGGPPGEAPPEITAPESNPRKVAILHEETRIKRTADMVRGADGKLYLGGQGLRDYLGGGFGWYDPETGEQGGLWKPFSGYSVQELCAVLGGTYIVISTKTEVDELAENVQPLAAKLFIWDVEQGALVAEAVPVEPGETEAERADKTGMLVEVAPGRVLGITEGAGATGAGVLYGMEVPSGEILFRKPIPRTLTLHWGHTSANWSSFVHGPDGYVYTILGSRDDPALVLVRIDPRDATVEPLGTVPMPLGKFLFVGRDLYLGGDDHFRVIRNVAVEAKAATAGEEALTETDGVEADAAP
jgi:hypothetical protein